MNEYHKQAEDFLKKYEIEFHYTNLGTSNKWNMVRYHYSVRFNRITRRGEQKEMQLDFWGSNADYTSDKKGIHPYDVLACLSGEDRFKTYNDIVFEFGDDLKGIDVDGLLEEARKMRKFFTKNALEELCEIQ